MNIFLEIVELPQEMKMHIDDHKIIIFHNKFGDFVINYNMNEQVSFFPDNTINSQHMFRICNIYNQYNFENLFDVLTSIIKKLESPYNYCTICGKCNVQYSHVPTYCSDECKVSIYEHWTNNIITDLFHHDKLLLDFLIRMLLSVIFMDPSRRELVFNPFPPTFNNCKEIENIIPPDMNQFNLKNLFEKINASKNDNDLIKLIGLKLYGLLKFTIMSNNTKLKSENINKNVNEFNELNIDKDMICFEVGHDFIKQEKFCIPEPEYLYHGSSIGNWYSILRNGLKNCSGTKLMSCGAAYGNGIYFSNSADLSLGYSVGYTFRVIGIAQVLNKEKYKKCQTIYVVPDEDQVLLKYLIYIPTSCVQYNETSLRSYITDRELAIKNTNNEMIMLVTKRLVREMSHIDKYKINNDLNLEIDVKCYNLKVVWTLKFQKNDFSINVDMIFPTTFPLDSPILMIKNPTISVHSTKTHLIDIYHNGVIYCNGITPKNWKANTKLLKIILELQDTINKADIRKVSDSEYEYMNVLTEYDKMLKINNMY